MRLSQNFRLPQFVVFSVFRKKKLCYGKWSHNGALILTFINVLEWKRANECLRFEV